MQQILVETLCQWARIRKVKTVYATVHPDNIYSHNNLTAAGFQLLTPTPLPKYGDVRNFYALSTAKPENHTDKYYTVYPYA